jgi:hypothetical protein
MASDDKRIISHLNRAFQSWQSGIQRTLDHSQELVDWFYAQQRHANEGGDSQSRGDVLAQANARLRALKQHLLDRFAREDTLRQLLTEVRGRTAELAVLRNQAEREQTILLDRLEQLFDTIQHETLEVVRWQEMANELNLFFDLLEQHEEQEAESISWLLPREPPLTVGARNDVSEHEC